MKRYFCIFILLLYFINTAPAMANTDYTKRTYGFGRIATSIEAARAVFSPSSLDGEEVIICCDSAFPDALSASPLAGFLDCPILLTTKDEVPGSLEDAVESLFGGYDEEDTVYLIGGEGVISDAVKRRFEKLGAEVERISGGDRYDTNLKVIDFMDEKGAGFDQAFLASGENFPDALAAAAFACKDGSMPVLLSHKDEIPSAAFDWLVSNDDIDLFVVGGEGAISQDVFLRLGNLIKGALHRVAGNNRYETALEVVKNRYLWDVQSDDGPEGQEFTFATGKDFPDALSGAVFSKGKNAPLLLCSGELDPSVRDFLEEMFEDARPGIDTGYGYILGGPGPISEAAETEIAELLSDGDYEPPDDDD